MKTRKCSRLMIVNEHEKLLLFQYKDEHKIEAFWATPGGELRPNETYLETAKRELYEETGLRNEIGELLLEREDVFAVARSTRALWQEKYYLVRCKSNSKIFAAAWSEEEKSTIKKWKWWSQKEMVKAGIKSFKPECLPELFNSILLGQIENETS